MTFVSLSFLYYFLPVVVGVSCLLPRGKTNAARNWFLLGASVFFCLWTRGWMFTWPFVLVVILQAAAYVVGVCRREIKPRKNPVYLALYLVGTPWAVEPMMPYPVLEQQLLDRENTVPRCAEGLRRLVWGLCQKVILADTLWMFSQEVEKFGQTGALLAWVRLAAVALAVYYALASYGNLAVGLGKLLGFDLCELTAGPLLWLGNLTRKPGLDQHRVLRGIVWVLLLLGGVLGTAWGCTSLSPAELCRAAGSGGLVCHALARPRDRNAAAGETVGAGACRAGAGGAGPAPPAGNGLAGGRRGADVFALRKEGSDEAASPCVLSKHQKRPPRPA